MGKGIGGHTRPNEGETNHWLTPPRIIKALGPFSLDPCAAPEPRPWPTAKHHIAPPLDGLALPWAGRVWLNPPYGPHTGGWMKKLADHGRGTAIIFARTETEMFFRAVWERATAVLFLRGRLTFHRPDGTPGEHNSGGPSVLVAYGHGDAVKLAHTGLAGYFTYLTRCG